MMAPEDGRLVEWDGEMAPGDRPPEVGGPLPAGATTDDTAMTVALAESLVANGNRFVGPDIAARYLEWARHGGTRMGKTTRIAMNRLEAGLSWTQSAVAVPEGDVTRVGAGTAMRCAPLAFAKGLNSDMISAEAHITHRDNEAVEGSRYVVKAVWEALNGKKHWGLEPPYRTLTAAKLAYGQRLKNLDSLEPGQVFKLLGRNGSVSSIIATADYCVTTATSYTEGIQMAVRAGGDTDTRAAIVGAILGAKFGLGEEKGIPERWIEQVQGSKHILDLESRLMEGT
jgi:ADP-ribosylglycohydrolase